MNHATTLAKEMQIELEYKQEIKQEWAKKHNKKVEQEFSSGNSTDCPDFEFVE